MNIQDLDFDKQPRFLCRLNIHKWGRWGNRYISEFSIYERKHCLFCGKGREHRIGSASNGQIYKREKVE